MRLTPFAKRLGLNPESVQRHVTLDPEGAKYVKIERSGKVHAYHVIDPEGLKKFLMRKGFPIEEENDD